MSEGLDALAKKVVEPHEPVAAQKPALSESEEFTVDLDLEEEQAVAEVEPKPKAKAKKAKVKQEDSVTKKPDEPV